MYGSNLPLSLYPAFSGNNLEQWSGVGAPNTDLEQWGDVGGDVLEDHSVGGSVCGAGRCHVYVHLPDQLPQEFQGSPGVDVIYSPNQMTNVNH